MTEQINEWMMLIFTKFFINWQFFSDFAQKLFKKLEFMLRVTKTLMPTVQIIQFRSSLINGVSERRTVDWTLRPSTKQNLKCQYPAFVIKEKDITMLLKIRKRENNENQKKKMNKWAGVSWEWSGGWATACGCSLYGPTQSSTLWFIDIFLNQCFK